MDSAPNVLFQGNPTIPRWKLNGAPPPSLLPPNHLTLALLAIWMSAWRQHRVVPLPWRRKHLMVWWPLPWNSLAVMVHQHVLPIGDCATWYFWQFVNSNQQGRNEIILTAWERWKKGTGKNESERRDATLRVRGRDVLWPQNNVSSYIHWKKEKQEDNENNKPRKWTHEDVCSL